MIGIFVKRKAVDLCSKWMMNDDTQQSQSLRPSQLNKLIIISVCPKFGGCQAKYFTLHTHAQQNFSILWTRGVSW